MPHNGTVKTAAQAVTRHFIRHVQPRLRQSITDHAVAVAMGVEGFAAASDAVMRLACHYGAGYLKGPDLLDLENWVIEDLADAVQELSP